MTRLAVIATTGDPTALGQMADAASRAAATGGEVRVFFRDESIPCICRPEASEALGVPPSADFQASLESLAGTGDVRLYACSSSLYIWGVTAADLAPGIHGARGLVAFLVEDLTDATEVLTY